MTGGSDTTWVLPFGTVTPNPGEITGAHVVLLLSQATSWPSHWGFRAETALVGTKPRSAAKTGMSAKGWVRRRPREDNHSVTPGTHTETSCGDSSGHPTLAQVSRGEWRLSRGPCPSPVSTPCVRGEPWDPGQEQPGWVWTSSSGRAAPPWWGLQHCVVPLGVTSVPFRAPWITAWASEFFFFRKSMVSRRSSSSVS